MKTNYKSLECNLWNTTQFRALSNIERLIYIYLIAGPQTRILGISKIDFEWVSFLFRIDCDELQEIFYLFEQREMMVYSPDTSEVYIPYYLVRYAQRGGVIMTRTLRREWTSVENRDLLRQCVAQNRAFMSSRPDYYNKTVDSFLAEAELLLRNEGTPEEKTKGIKQDSNQDTDPEVARYMADLKAYFEQRTMEEEHQIEKNEEDTEYDDMLKSLPFIIEQK